MSEMTVEQSIEVLKSKSYNHLRFEIEQLDCACNMAIKALEENEKLKAEVKRYWVECDELEMENKKLKEEYNKLAIEYNKLVDESSDTMSAVEVLEWLSNKEYGIPMFEVFNKANSWSIKEVLQKYTPQEIVDRITKYKNGNKLKDATVSENQESSKEEPEFKVGDWVNIKNKIGVDDSDAPYIITKIDKEKLIIYATSSNGKVELQIMEWNCEHAEPPKEEPQVEWFWECYLMDDFNNVIIKCCEKSEESAIKACEKLANENDWKMFYRKVCVKR